MAVSTLPLPDRGRGAMLIARFTEVRAGATRIGGGSARR
jgi:hypothetical protein